MRLRTKIEKPQLTSKILKKYSKKVICISHKIKKVNNEIHGEIVAISKFYIIVNTNNGENELVLKRDNLNYIIPPIHENEKSPLEQ